MKPKKFYVFLPEKSRLGKGMQGHAPGCSGPTEGFTVRARDFFCPNRIFVGETTQSTIFYITQKQFRLFHSNA